MRECGIFDGHSGFGDILLYFMESFSCVNKKQKRGGVGRMLFLFLACEYLLWVFFSLFLVSLSSDGSGSSYSVLVSL